MNHDKNIQTANVFQHLVGLAVSSWLAARIHLWAAATLPFVREPVPLERYQYLLVIFVPSWLWLLARLRIHEVRTLMGPATDQLRRVLWLHGWSLLVIAAVLTAAQVELNRSLIVIFLAVSTLITTGVTAWQRGWVRAHRSQAVALALGNAPSPALAKDFGQARGRNVDVLPNPTPEALRARLRAGPVDEIVVAADLPREALRELILTGQEAGVPTLLKLDHFDLDLVTPETEFIGAGLYLAYQHHSPSRVALLAKSIIDRTLAALMVLTLAPLLLAVWVAVRIKMGAPVLFVQTRGGLNGRPFPMLKFRTMRPGAEAERATLIGHNEMDGPVFKMRDDPRVTPLGRFLRRYSIDELPQLFNVIAGHMSLVGPRPLPLVETQQLAGAHRRRLSMRPGLSCLWQISGRNDLAFDQWMALDLQYVDRWSLGLDLAIILKTIPAVLSRRGAS